MKKDSELSAYRHKNADVLNIWWQWWLTCAIPITKAFVYVTVHTERDCKLAKSNSRYRP